MKWLRETFSILAEKVEPKQAFILLTMCIVCTVGYFTLDRILTFQRNMALAQNNKVMVEKTPINTDVLYKDRTLFENKAEETK